MVDDEFDGSENDENETEEQEESSKSSSPVDYRQVPGSHVISEGEHLGTYPNNDEAQAFIDGHLKPQDKDAKIVEGAASTESEA